MKVVTDADLVDRFLDGSLEPDELTHETHVRVTYLLLRAQPLPETLIQLRDGLKRVAASAGHPEKYHETITFAFAALINERIQAAAPALQDWTEFAEENPDLMEWRSGALLAQIYSGETLHAETARRTFLLPFKDDRARRSAPPRST